MSELHWLAVAFMSGATVQWLGGVIVRRYRWRKLIAGLKREEAQIARVRAELNGFSKAGENEE